MNVFHSYRRQVIAVRPLGVGDVAECAAPTVSLLDDLGLVRVSSPTFNMASLDKDLPLPPKTPSFYDRLKAMSTRTWSRSESRMSSSRDQHTSRPPSAAASRQGSIRRSHDTRAERSQSRASTTKPDRMQHSVRASSGTRNPSSSSALHTRQQEQQQRQQQHIPTNNHIVYQAKYQPSYDYKLESPDRAQTIQPDVGYGYSSPNSPVMPFDYYQHFPRPQISQNVLRRRPSIIGHYISEKQPTEVEGRPSLSLDTSLAPHEVRASKAQTEAVSMSRRTPDDPKYSVRQPARSLKTPDNPRANSRATSRAATYISASPSSPSTTRHDTPSVFSHASRATSRTAYSPSSINAMEPQTWTTDPDAPPVPEIRNKLPRTTATKQPFVPPELAHLAYTPNMQTQTVSSRNQFAKLTSSVEHYPHAGPLGFAAYPTTTDGGVSSRPSPAHDLQPAVWSSSSSPRPLKSMDPCLRARVTLNTAAQPQLAETTANRSCSKPKSLAASSRQAAARVKVVDVPPRSSFTSATATPRLSLDKHKPATSHSSARPSMTQYRSPRLSIQCQGDEDLSTVQPARSSAKFGQKASHSRAFSFSKTPLKTSSSMESLKSKFSFAQRVFNKSVDQLSCVGPVDVQQQQSVLPDPVSNVNEKPSTRQSLDKQPRNDSIRLRTKQALSELHLLSPSSRTSIDLPRHVNTKSKSKSATAVPSASYTDRSSISDLSPTSQAAQLNTQRMSQNSSSTVRGKESRVSEGANVKDNSSRSSKSKQSRDSSSTNGHDALSPVEGQEFMRFSTMTSVRESSSSERSSDRTSNQAPRLSRLHSADSGRSTSLGSYGLFPQTKTTPPKSKAIPAKSSEQQIKGASGQEFVDLLATTRTVDDQHVDINLRLGALSASTAISSKVLFSPGAFQVQRSVGEKILVMDGSGEGKSYTSTFESQEF